MFQQIVGLILVSLAALACGNFLWFETPPAWDDPCTLVEYGHKRFDMIDIHWPTHCRDAGLLWLGTTGRLKANMSIDLENKQEFRLCMTGGLSDRLHIFYNYAGHYLEPMTFPVWYMRPRHWESCKNSINGSMELLFESPLYWIDYYTFVKFNITEIDDYQPKPQPPEEPWIPGAERKPKKEKDVKPSVNEDDIDWEKIDVDDVLADIDLESDDFSYWEMPDSTVAKNKTKGSFQQ